MPSLPRRLLVAALSAGLLAPAGPALAAPSAPVEVTAVVRAADGRLSFVTEHVPTRARGLERAGQLRARPHVVAAEVASPVRALADDPLRPQQWGLTRLAAEQTWRQGPASGQLVAVVDTGVDGAHPELSAVTAPGLDLVGTGDGRSDPNGHGTHVAGVVAAVHGNGVGGAGLAQGTRILPVRALDANGSGYDSDVAKGVVWAVDNGAKVVNLSLGGERQSSVLTAAVDYALGRGVVVVAAAGNAGAVGDPVLYPAATAGVVAVGAVDADDRRPAWSSTGAHLAVVAPGVGILSTLPGGRHASWDGTSMAAPFVAAAAALIVSDEPALTPALVRTRLTATARDLGPAGHDPQTGAGMVDVVAARVTRPLPVEPVATDPVATEPVATDPVVTPAPVPVATVPQPTADPAPPTEPISSPAPQPVTAEPVAPAPTAAAPVAPAPASSPPAPADPAPVAAPHAGTAPAEPPSVTVFPAVIPAGQRVTVTYRGTPGAVVDVLSRTQPATTFSRITSVVLDGTGTATSTHAPQRNTRITARSATGHLSASQPLVAVRSVASLSVARTGVRTYAFTGRVYPALNGRLVSLYRNGVLVAQGRTGADGIYVIRKTLAAGTSTFQARTGNDMWNLGTRSPLRTARVF